MARQKQLVRSRMKSLSDTRGDWAKENTQTRTFMSANTQVPTRPRPPSLCITVFMLQSYGFAGKYDPLRHVRICVCVSLRASVFRLSEELCYRLCFLSNFVCQNETKIIWCLLSIQASYPIYLDQCLEKAVWVNEWVTLLLTLDHWPRWPPNLG